MWTGFSTPNSVPTEVPVIRLDAHLSLSLSIGVLWWFPSALQIKHQIMKMAYKLWHDLAFTWTSRLTSPLPLIFLMSSLYHSSSQTALAHLIPTWMLWICLPSSGPLHWASASQTHSSAYSAAGVCYSSLRPLLLLLHFPLHSTVYSKVQLGWWLNLSCLLRYRLDNPYIDSGGLCLA